MFRIILALSVLMSVSAQAAQPPYWDQVTKLKTVIGSMDLSKEASSIADKIKSVTEIKANTFAVQFERQSCVMYVTIRAIESQDGMVGPTKYEVTKIAPNGCERP